MTAAILIIFGAWAVSTIAAAWIGFAYGARAASGAAKWRGP